MYDKTTNNNDGYEICVNFFIYICMYLFEKVSCSLKCLICMTVERRLQDPCQVITFEYRHNKIFIKSYYSNKKNLIFMTIIMLQNPC